MNTTSLVVGWFSALILMWLVVSLETNAASSSQDAFQSAEEHAAERSIKDSVKNSTERYIPRGF